MQTHYKKPIQNKEHKKVIIIIMTTVMQIRLTLNSNSKIQQFLHVVLLQGLGLMFYFCIYLRERLFTGIRYLFQSPIFSIPKKEKF